VIKLLIDSKIIYSVGDWSQDQGACYAGKHLERLVGR